MSSSAIRWKVVKGGAVVAVCVAVVGYVGGADNTKTIAHTAATGFGWGLGVEARSAPDVVTGIRAGFAGDSSSTFLPSANGPLAPAAAKPKVKKVPNCTAKQKKAAPASCA